jgi:hypothetical protein
VRARSVQNAKVSIFQQKSAGFNFSAQVAEYDQRVKLMIELAPLSSELYACIMQSMEDYQ